MHMGVPKSKITRSKRGLRRAHDGIISRQYGECSNCGELKLSHHVCDACGYYGSGNKQKRIINKIDSDVGDDEDWRYLARLGTPES